MKQISYRCHRFQPQIIQHAIWLYCRFTLSFRDVEDLPAERGLEVSYETVRRWVLKFGHSYAKRLRRFRPRPDDRWHLNEMFVKISGRRVYLWRAVDAEGEVLDCLVQPKRNKTAALKLMRKLLKKQGYVPSSIVTDNLPSYGPALRELGLSRRHETGWGKNQQGGKFTPARSTTRAQDAALQISRLRATLSFDPCRRVQPFQRPASSDFMKDPPIVPHRGNCVVEPCHPAGIAGHRQSDMCFS